MQDEGTTKEPLARFHKILSCELKGFNLRIYYLLNGLGQDIFPNTKSKTHARNITHLLMVPGGNCMTAAMYTKK